MTRSIIFSLSLLTVFTFSYAIASMSDLQKMRTCALSIERSAVFVNMLQSQNTASSMPSDKGFYVDIEESKQSCRFTFLGEKSVDSISLQRKSSRNGSDYRVTLSGSGATFFVNVPTDEGQPCKASSSNDYGDSRKSVKATSLLTDKTQLQFANFFKIGVVGQFAELTQREARKWGVDTRRKMIPEIEAAIGPCQQIKSFSEDISSIKNALAGASSNIGNSGQKVPRATQ